MAGTSLDYDVWIPEEWDSKVIQRVKKASVIELVARSEPMSTDLKHVPRSGAIAWAVKAKNTDYTASTGTEGEVQLIARKPTSLFFVAEEDLADSAPSILEAKKYDAALDYAKFLDHACLGVNAVENGTTIPFTSLFKHLSTTDATVPGGTYTANDNVKTVATGAWATPYLDLSELLSRVEGNDYWDDSTGVVIAHPSFKRELRDVLDANDRPIMVETATGDGVVHSIFGYPIHWTFGCRLDTTAKSQPTSTNHTLLYFANKNLLLRGDRAGLESAVSREAGWIADQVAIKMRARKGFTVGHPRGFAVIDRTP